MYNGQQVIVGLDSEWKPNQFPFMSNKTAVLQLCVARDAEKLRIEYGLHCSNVPDVREITMKRWPSMFYSKPGLKDIANLGLGLHMPKPVDVCRSVWQSRVLDDPVSMH
ncbi:hypothetical protein SLEP1_g48170 [Rubroshorea leprosula]|uniref:3'-5' exonuclease domain-containing protein n=1 Tax=Rubroshorea leprosula TaxID=152421 RepID=A0AAV5LUP6_9ROSI|nr:hypothetical protein SLEP1_g48170 [Rubroshorea leprosula]